MNRKNTPEAFYAKVDKNGPNGCWSWLGSTNKLGYGQLGYQGRRTTAHRLSYELNKGKIPDGQIVRHRCDNPNCCNPDHLLLGTHQDNANDRTSRGRGRGPAGTPSINPVFKSVGDREAELFGVCESGHTQKPGSQHKRYSDGVAVCASCYWAHRTELDRIAKETPVTEAETAVVLAIETAALALIRALPEALRSRVAFEAYLKIQDLFMRSKFE